MSVPSWIDKYNPNHYRICITCIKSILSSWDCLHTISGNIMFTNVTFLSLPFTTCTCNQNLTLQGINMRWNVYSTWTENHPCSIMSRIPSIPCKLNPNFSTFQFLIQSWRHTEVMDSLPETQADGNWHSYCYPSLTFNFSHVKTVYYKVTELLGIYWCLNLGKECPSPNLCTSMVW